MALDVLEAEAVEESVPPEGDDTVAADVRPLPEVRRTGDVALSSSEVRTVALAAAGGLVAGAATVAVIRVVRAGASRATRSSRKRRPDRPAKVLASRSFLVDVHLLGNK
jgi:protein involved in polysaccharide export with SLBB domain